MNVESVSASKRLLVLSKEPCELSQQREWHMWPMQKHSCELCRDWSIGLLGHSERPAK